MADYQRGGMLGGPVDPNAPNSKKRSENTSTNPSRGTKVDTNENSTSGYQEHNSAYGGTTGYAYYDQSTGQWRNDPSYSGRAQDEKYYQGLAAAAAQRQAYQANFADADRDAAMGQQARGLQSTAADMYRRTAMGEDSRAQQLGRTSLANAQMQQQAAAASAGGDAMTRAGALQNQQQGQAAFQTRGEQALAAQKADEMQRAREGWMRAQTEQRGLDQQAQQLNEQQAEIQNRSEQGQRDLNDAGMIGNEQMAYDVNAASQEGALAYMGVDTQRLQQQQASDAADYGRTQRYVGAGIQAGATFGAGAINPRSDERVKRGVRGLGEAAMRRGY